MTADAIGGVWTYALELARALEPYGVKILLATMGVLPNKQQRAEADSVSNIALFESLYKLEWMENPWTETTAAGNWLLDLERCFKPHVIHLNGFVHAALPWRAPVLIVGHSCVLSWQKAVKNLLQPPKLDSYRNQVAKGLLAANLVAAPTHAMLDSLEEHYGKLHKKRVVANARSDNIFIPSEKENFVLSAGRIWDEAKNIETLARAAENLPFPVFVAGDEINPDNGSAAELEHVRLLGKLSTPEIAVWMSRAAVFALPARYEPFGLTPLEAALAGCALVLGDIPTLREVWQDNAVFVAPDDKESLHEILKKLIENKNWRDKLARKARDRALEFTTQKMAKNYLSIYADLMSGAAEKSITTEAG